MVEIIVGKGTGKTKHLLDRVNQDITSVQGTLVYIDKSPKYMYQLDSRVRMINMRIINQWYGRIDWFSMWCYFTE